MRTKKDQKLHIYIFHLFFINIKKVEYHCMKMPLFELCLVCESFMQV